MARKPTLSELEQRIDELTEENAKIQEHASAAWKLGLYSALIAAVATIGGAAVAGIFGLAGSDVVVSCPSELEKAASIAREYPDAWVPIDEENLVERECNVNEYVANIINSQ